jgi:hypothetical protein
MILTHTVEKIFERFRRYKPYVASLRERLGAHEGLKHCSVLFLFLDTVDEINERAEKRDLVAVLRNKKKAMQQKSLVQKLMALSGLAAQIEGLPEPLKSTLNGVYILSISPALLVLQQLTLSIC